MSTFFTALTSVAGLLSNQSQMVGFWVSGGFRGATWLDVKIILAAGIPGFLAAVLLAPKINVISLGRLLRQSQCVVIASLVHLSSGIILLGMVNEDKLMWELQKSLSIIFLSKSNMQEKIITRI